jgi:hypothetical protein
MPDDQKLTPADASDIAESVAFALLFSGRKRVHDSDRMTASIAAQRIVRHLERCGFVVSPLSAGRRRKIRPQAGRIRSPKI